MTIGQLSTGSQFHSLTAQPPIHLAAVAGRAAVEIIIQFAIDVAGIGVADRAQAVDIKGPVCAVERIIGPSHPIGDPLFQHNRSLLQLELQADTAPLPFLQNAGHVTTNFERWGRLPCLLLYA